jgi:RIO kinase 2
VKEFAYLKALHDAEFPCPRPVDANRHVVVMERLDATLLEHVAHLAHPAEVYEGLMNLILKFASYGLIHGDFNEFNIMISDTEKIYVIDFPQMVSIAHKNAAFYFERDVNCIRTYFKKRFKYESTSYPNFIDHVKRVYSLDSEVAASGYKLEMERELQAGLEEQSRCGERYEEAEGNSSDIDDSAEENSDVADAVDQRAEGSTEEDASGDEHANENESDDDDDESNNDSNEEDGGNFAKEKKRPSRKYRNQREEVDPKVRARLEVTRAKEKAKNYRIRTL